MRKKIKDVCEQNRHINNAAQTISAPAELCIVHSRIKQFDDKSRNKIFKIKDSIKISLTYIFV